MWVLPVMVSYAMQVQASVYEMVLRLLSLVRRGATSPVLDSF